MSNLPDARPLAAPAHGRAHEPVGAEPSREGHGLWARRRGAASPGPLDGYHVQAIDGPVGEVIESDDSPDRGYVIAATDRRLRERKPSAGRTVMLPTGLIARVDPESRVIVVACTLAKIGGAPAFENDRYRDGAYLTELEVHYSSDGSFGAAATG